MLKPGAIKLRKLKNIYSFSENSITAYEFDEGFGERLQIVLITVEGLFCGERIRKIVEDTMCSGLPPT